MQKSWGNSQHYNLVPCTVLENDLPFGAVVDSCMALLLHQLNLAYCTAPPPKINRAQRATVVQYCTVQYINNLTF